MTPRTVAGDEAGLTQALEALRQGGLVIVPTETFYGIACDALSTEGVERLVLAKGREEGKPIPLLAGSMASVLDSVDNPPPLLSAVAEDFWPGPLTVVLRAAPGFPFPVTAGSGTVGIRIPGPSFAYKLAAAFGTALTGTSANPAGSLPPTRADRLDPDLARRVDLIVDGGPTPGGEPSTVLDLTASPPRILREGALGPRVRAFLLEVL